MLPRHPAYWQRHRWPPERRPAWPKAAPKVLSLVGEMARFAGTALPFAAAHFNRVSIFGHALECVFQVAGVRICSLQSGAETRDDARDRLFRFLIGQQLRTGKLSARAVATIKEVAQEPALEELGPPYPATGLLEFAVGPRLGVDQFAEAGLGLLRVEGIGGLGLVAQIRRLVLTLLLRHGRTAERKGLLTEFTPGFDRHVVQALLDIAPTQIAHHYT